VYLDAGVSYLNGSRNQRSQRAQKVLVSGAVVADERG